MASADAAMVDRQFSATRGGRRSCHNRPPAAARVEQETVLHGAGGAADTASHQSYSRPAVLLPGLAGGATSGGGAAASPSSLELCQYFSASDCSPELLQEL
jgi:hypothetical protein